MRQFVSIVMPVRNQAEYIRSALDSVLDDGFDSLELVVADGGSTDGTVEILAEYAARDSRLRWVSEPDTGPAEAVNKAVQRSRGTVIGWLNADDVYVKGAIPRAVAALTSRASPVMVYGEAEHIDDAGGVLGRYPTQRPETPIREFEKGCFICQPTVFFKRTVPLLLGPLDNTLKTAFDFDYWLRVFHAFPGRIAFIPEIQAQSRWHAGAISFRMRREVALEGLRILHRQFGSAPAHWALTHVEEIRRAQVPDLQGYFEEFLGEVRSYLSDNDYHWVCQVAAGTVNARLGQGE